MLGFTTKRFKNSANKRAYLYIVTPTGIETKTRISVRFLKRKVEAFESLRLEIEELKTELDSGKAEKNWWKSWLLVAQDKAT